MSRDGLTVVAFLPFLDLPSTALAWCSSEQTKRGVSVRTDVLLPIDSTFSYTGPHYGLSYSLFLPLIAASGPEKGNCHSLVPVGLDRTLPPPVLWVVPLKRTLFKSISYWPGWDSSDTLCHLCVHFKSHSLHPEDGCSMIL